MLCLPWCFFPQQQTEWQRYLRQSLEVVAKVMELLPTHAFSTLVSSYPDHKYNVKWAPSAGVCYKLFDRGHSAKQIGRFSFGCKKLARRRPEVEGRSLFFFWFSQISWCVLKRVLQWASESCLLDTKLFRSSHLSKCKYLTAVLHCCLSWPLY